MKRFTINFRPSAAKSLRALPRNIQLRVVETLSALEEQPRPPGFKRLQGHADLHRVRIGDYRLVYQVDDGAITILVVQIGHRRDVYRGL